ncbi:hypothetical protein BD626DRAFT_549897 [Schizophyllum amplum]|uniref:Beta-trefoil DNA-binding domain-containing protein n=1 Tax=Schizophyllum amplum TaxID=97359 RepID=A0A550C657_9AGAR|nr:hypothetical protein BD626DRAFT_549897 [Auriculariopsis ampla]
MSVSPSAGLLLDPQLQAEMSTAPVPQDPQSALGALHIQVSEGPAGISHAAETIASTQSAQSLLQAQLGGIKAEPAPPEAQASQQHLPAVPSSLPILAVTDIMGEDAHSKIRRVVRDHVSNDPSRAIPMTTVICLHAAVAQKSYGTEKRFLCPLRSSTSKQLSMAIISETGERAFEQRAALDSSMTSSFKFLHVTSTAKAKSFQLDAPLGRVWASFDSAPVTIISKPSKKTAKTRNIASCILAGGPVSLFNRINSQTVRTKYMTIEHAQLCASNIAWSAFNVNVVRRPTDPPPVAGPQAVTYGSEIVLSDTHSGISTSPLVIRKVEKSKVIADDGGPVSQMQKVVLQRLNPDGSRHYLSAAGPVSGAPSGSSSSTQAGTHPLIFQSPRASDDSNKDVHNDEVDDYLCWTIVGISKFQYTFFDAFGGNNTIPEMPITPFPTLFTAPVYRQPHNTIDLTVSNFFYGDMKNGQHKALEVYLGNLGPLAHRIYQMGPSGPLTNVGPFVTTVSETGTMQELMQPSMTPTHHQSYMPNSVHTIVTVTLPPITDIVKALEEDAAVSNDPSRSHTPVNVRPPNGTPPPRPPPPASIGGRSLPLLFIRASDGIGYHSGRTIAVDNLFPGIDLHALPQQPTEGIDTNWLAAAHAAALNDGGWQLRVQ